MNIKGNPWSFLPGDVVAGAPINATGLTLNADGTVTLTTVAAFGVNANDSVTVRNADAAAYNGFYRVLIGSAGTVFTLLPQFSIPAGTAASGNGQVAKCLYTSQMRVDDLSWQNATAVGDQVDITDRNGNPVWNATCPIAPGQQNRGKVYWVNGWTPFVITSGIVLATIN